MRDAIGFEKLQNFRYLYAPKCRCTNNFTAIYEERISIWKKTRRITPYGFTPKPSVGWTAHWSLGYLVTDDTTEYLSKALLTSLRGMLDINDDLMRSLLFKLCVETNMMMHVIAAHFKDDIGDLRALRGYAADEVKRTYGRISFDNAVKIQSSPED